MSMAFWRRRRDSRDRGSKYTEDYPAAENEMNLSFRPGSSSYNHNNNNTINDDASNKHQGTPTKTADFPHTPSADMLRQQQPNRAPEPQRWSAPAQDHSHMNGSMSPSMGGGGMNGANAALESPPDMLTRAFNETIRPYQERISLLQSDLEAAHQQIQRLESYRADMHNWIDKRGLRPDLPPELSAGLATNNTPVAASTLATQLDRKMTMLNYSLHHLADALPSSPPTSTVTSSLAALLPSIGHLSTLPAGPAFAFESLIKLAGNLNSHSTGEESDEDRNAIGNFYSELDQAMVRVVGKRVVAITEEEENWDVGRDIKRLEKTGAFLRKEMGVRNYFLQSLEVMKGERRAPPQGAQAGGGPVGQGGEPLTRYSSDSH